MNDMKALSDIATILCGASICIGIFGMVFGIVALFLDRINIGLIARIMRYVKYVMVGCGVIGGLILVIVVVANL